MATRVEAAGATAARTGAARRVAHGGAGQVRRAATPPGLARERHAAPPAATAPAPFVTAPPATVRGRAVPGPVAHVLVALVRPVPAGTARVPAASATIAPAAVARAAMAPVQVVRVKVALGAAAHVPAASVTIAPVAVARAAMAPVQVVLGAAARVLVASVTIARAAVARARVAPAVMARAGIRPGAVPTARPQAPPGRRGLLGVPPTAHPGMATAHAATGLPAVVRSAPIVPPAAARQVPDPMAIARPAAARQTDAPLVARPLDARPATGTPGAGDHPAGPRPPQDAQVLSGIARLPGVVQVPAALGAMRARIAVPPRTVASLTAAPPPGPRQPGRAACRRSRPASPWTN